MKERYRGTTLRVRYRHNGDKNDVSAIGVRDQIAGNAPNDPFPSIDRLSRPAH